MTDARVLDLRETLLEELARRKRENKKYSLRSLAKHISLSPTTLSQILNNKRGLSAKKIDHIATVLGLPPNQKISGPSPGQYSQLSHDTLESLSNWYYMAILSLADLKKNEASPKWVSGQLGITLNEASEALDRLLRLGLIKIVGGKLQGTQLNIETTTDVPSAVLRRCHSQNLNLALQAIEEVSLEWRDMTSIVMPISSELMAEAKKDIRKFRRKFCKKYENLKATDVYILAVQLFPLTRSKWVFKNEI